MARENLVKTVATIPAEQYSAANTKLLAGIPAGDIIKLPGMGRRNVSLNEFVRDGLQSVSRKSFIRSEIRHHEAHNGRYMGAIDHPDNVCAACDRTLGDMFNYGMREYTMKPQMTVPTYEVVRFVPRGDLDNDRFGTYFCFDCVATGRETMLHAMIQKQVLHRYRDCIADDGNDVFEFVWQSIVEDRLHGMPEYDGVELRLLHGGLYGGGNDPSGQFFTTIGGRLAYHEYRTRPMEQARQRAINAALAKEQEQAPDAPQASTSDENAPNVETPAKVETPVKQARKRPAKHAR